jgi:uncharacterized protein YkwD
MIELINLERAKAHCAALKPNAALTKSARDHSTLMAARQELTHQFPDEPDLGTRITAAGYHWGGIAENAAPGSFTTPQMAMYGLHDPTHNFTGFMESPGHRANILNCGLKDIGIGAVPDKDGGPWWTQDFGSTM